MHNKTYNKTCDKKAPSMARVLIYPSLDSRRLEKADVISEDSWSDCAMSKMQENFYALVFSIFVLARNQIELYCKKWP